MKRGKMNQDFNASMLKTGQLMMVTEVNSEVIGDFVMRNVEGDIQVITPPFKNLGKNCKVRGIRRYRVRFYPLCNLPVNQINK